jgi:hypothetical protein
MSAGNKTAATTWHFNNNSERGRWRLSPAAIFAHANVETMHSSVGQKFMCVSISPAFTFCNHQPAAEHQDIRDKEPTDGFSDVSTILFLHR